MKKTAKVVGISLAALILLVIVTFIVILIRMVTPEEAQKASQKHFDDVKAKIMAVSGYQIVKEGRPTLTTVQDEIGSKDYNLSADFLVQKLPSGSTETGVADDIENFAKQLAKNDYGITVENAPQVNDRPVLICVYAFRYLNDDGTYIPQGSTANVSKYITKEQFSKGYDQSSGKDYTSSCADLLK